MVTRFAYDDAGRQTTLIENYQASELNSSPSPLRGEGRGEGASEWAAESLLDEEGCSPSADTNRTTITTYTPDSQTATLTASNAATGNQVTTYVYGTTLDDSDIAASILLRSVIYPDSSSGSDQVDFTYNRQAQRTTLSDQNGNVYAYDYDLLGRTVQDRVIALGSGVDSAIRRLQTTYEVRGLIQTLTSYSSATPGSGTAVNQVRFTYNSFRQSVNTFQAHAGTVDVMSTPSVQAGFANVVANSIRPTSLTYPGGRVLTYDYDNTTNSINYRASRIDAIKEGGTVLARYRYLGLNSVVEVESPEADLEYTLVSLDGEDDPDTGDIYTGLDRFGRIKDCRWRNTDADTDLSRTQYGYDRDSNRIWRKNPTAPESNYDWLYNYDGLQRLKNADRGTLSSSGPSTLDSRLFAQCWTLDETGNWNNFRQDDTGSGTWTLNQQRTANQANEIVQITQTTGSAWATPTYDKNGNMRTIPRPHSPLPTWDGLTADQWNLFTADQWAGFQSTGKFDATYDAWNRLVKVTGVQGTVQENQYDARNYRTIRRDYTDGTLSETRHSYYTDAWQVVEERLGSSTDANQQNVWGIRYIDDLVLRDRTTTSTLDERLYACQDANWNVTAVVNTDGEVQERYEYDPYGNTTFLAPDYTARGTSSFDWTTLYTARSLDSLTQLYDFRNRYFNARLGSFTQRDPIGYVSGANLYGGYFVPNGVDPEGTDTISNLANFFGGWGDNFTFGATNLIREGLGWNESGIDPNSTAYSAGEWAGFANTVALGVAGGIKAAGKPGRGKEFSHWYPKRRGGPRTIFNGNYVPVKKHVLSDPYRYKFMPKPWKQANPMPSKIYQQCARIPYVYIGTLTGALMGFGGAAANKKINDWINEVKTQVNPENELPPDASFIGRSNDMYFVP